MLVSLSVARSMLLEASLIDQAFLRQLKEAFPLRCGLIKSTHTVECFIHLDAIGSYPFAQSHIPRPCLMHTMYILECIFN